MDIGLQSLTLNTPHLQTMLDFFQALGFPLSPHQVNKGSPFYKGKLGGIEVNLIAIPQRDRSSTPDLALRIVVDQIENVVATLRKLPGVQVLMEVEFLNEGKTALITDPDGRSFELLGQFTK